MYEKLEDLKIRFYSLTFSEQDCPADIWQHCFSYSATRSISPHGRGRPSDNSNFFRSFLPLFLTLIVTWGINWNGVSGQGFLYSVPMPPPCNQGKNLGGTNNPCGTIELSLICRVTPPGAVGRRSSTNSTSLTLAVSRSSSSFDNVDVSAPNKATWIRL